MPETFDLIELERRLREHVGQIASCPRPPGSAAHVRVREYVRERLSHAGFVVQDDPFAGGPAPGVNLLTQPVGAENQPLVIVGAHYDSLPDTPGADDNASAVAALIELAGWIGQRLSPSRWQARLQLAAYDQEEYGLRGSRHHSGRCEGPLRAMLSLEMLGYVDARPGGQRLPAQLAGMYPDVGDFIGVVGNLASAWLIDQVAQSLRQIDGLPVQTLAVPGDGSVLPDSRRSDHAPFWDRGLRAAMLTDTSFLRNPHYHQPTDTPDTLNYAFMAQVTAGVCIAVERLLLADDVEVRVNKTSLDCAWPLWQAGQLIYAGRLLFESMPEHERPRWAIRLLKLAVARCAVSSAPVENLVGIVDDPTRWGKAHDAFRQLRRAGLALDRQTLTDEQQLLGRLLCVGEITAKVVYNASGFPYPFDNDAGWWVASIFKYFLDRVNGVDSSEEAWLVLCGQKESP